MNTNILLCVNSVDYGTLQWRLLRTSGMLPETVQYLHLMHGLYIGINWYDYTQDVIQLADSIFKHCYNKPLENAIEDPSLVRQLSNVLDTRSTVFDVPLRVVEIGYYY